MQSGDRRDRLREQGKWREEQNNLEDAKPPREEPLTREDIERMLVNLRERREQQRLNPRAKLVCQADRCLPPPVPTEHREQVLIMLLDKMEQRVSFSHTQSIEKSARNV